MYLLVSPNSLERSAGGLVALAATGPVARVVLHDMEAVGACLPGLASTWTASSGLQSPLLGGHAWAAALAALDAGLQAQAGSLGRAAAAYRATDDRAWQ